MAPISLIQEQHFLIGYVTRIGQLHDIEMDIVVNHALDSLILGAYCVTGSYQGVLLTRDEIETGGSRYYDDLITKRINAAIEIVKPTFCEADEYDEVMQAQEIMDKLQP